MTNIEIWKDIKGYEGVYQVSNLGRIKSLHKRNNKTEHIMKQSLKANGYYQIRLKNKGSCKDYIVHRLVAMAFVPNPNNYPCVNHKDENKSNNKSNNLEWCTVSYNNTYGNRIKRIKEKFSKKVEQYDIRGNFIAKYSSITSAAEETNIGKGNIWMCLKGKYKQTKGYVWKYEGVIETNE